MQVDNRNLRIGTNNRWLRATILIISWLIIVSLAQDVWQIRVGFGRITDSQNRLEVEEKRNLELKKKESLLMTDEYRERLIRDKLNMQKGGEVLVVMPRKEFVGQNVGSRVTAPEQNWEKWWKLLRG